MNALYDLCRVHTATTGTGTITLGAASSGYLTFAQAGVPDGAVVSYGIADGGQSETGAGTYSAGAGTLTRSVYRSTGTGNNTPISLSGNAQVFITALSVDFQSFAPLASPVFTGNPQAPTPSPGDSDTSVSTTAFVQAALAATPTGAPNKLLNPFMEIDQQNEGAALSGNGVYLVDGVVLTVLIGTASGQRSTDAPPGYPNSVIMTQTGTGSVTTTSWNGLARRLEWDDFLDAGFGTSAAQSVSVAFWVKASLAGTYCVSLNNFNATRSYVFNVVITAANTWQLVTQTIPGDTGGTWATTGNATGLNFRLTTVAGTTVQTATPNTWLPGDFKASTAISNTMAATAGSTLQWGPCGLWVAPAPQPLLRTSFQAELARCQRYYEKSYDIGQAIAGATPVGCATIIQGLGGGALINWAGTNPLFKVTKRVAPTITAYSTVTGAAGKARDTTNNADINASMANQGMSCFVWWANLSTANANVSTQLHWTADARL